MNQKAGSKPYRRGSDLCPTAGWGMCPDCLNWSLTRGPRILHQEGLKPGPVAVSRDRKGGRGWSGHCEMLWYTQLYQPLAGCSGSGDQKEPLDLLEAVAHFGWLVEFNTLVVKGKLALKGAAWRTPEFQCMLWAESCYVCTASGFQLHFTSGISWQRLKGFTHLMKKFSWTNQCCKTSRR